MTTTSPGRMPSQPQESTEPVTARAQPSADKRRRPHRAGHPHEVRDQAVATAADAAVHAMASWGFVWVRDVCGCDGSGDRWIKDATLPTGGQYTKCVCRGQGRVWYPQGRKRAVQLTDRQLVQLYEKERAKRM